MSPSADRTTSPDIPSEAREGDAQSATGLAPEGTPPEREISLQEALTMAQQLQRSDRLDEAEAIYLQVLSQLHEEPNTLHFLGVLRFQQGRHRDALNFISQAIEQMPEEPGPLLNLANVLIEVGHYDEAVGALHRVIGLRPNSLTAYNNLGVMHLRRGHFDEAEAAFKQALAVDTEVSYVHSNLAGLYFRTGRMKDCATHNLKSLATDKRNPRARKLLSRSLELMGEHEQAVQNLRDWVAEAPNDPEARHYLAAIGEGAAPERASDGYVKQVFDRFADSFDVQLEKLDYQAPALVCAALQAYGVDWPTEPTEPVLLDAGCGTGLCGPLLRALLPASSGRLEGVDLSPGMLKRAQGRKVYDALVEAELTAFLSERPGRYHAIVSADVLIYFGELRPVFKAAAAALHTGGLLVFSVETHADDGPGYQLAIHGRYSHSAAFVKQVLTESGLQLLQLESQVLRTELLEPVHGLVVVARRSAEPR
jgi:predicted TPR repeat methyltransferase